MNANTAARLTGSEGACSESGCFRDDPEALRIVGLPGEQGPLARELAQAAHG